MRAIVTAGNPQEPSDERTAVGSKPFRSYRRTVAGLTPAWRAISPIRSGAMCDDSSTESIKCGSYCKVKRILFGGSFWERVRSKSAFERWILNGGGAAFAGNAKDP